MLAVFNKERLSYYLYRQNECLIGELAGFGFSCTTRSADRQSGIIKLNLFLLFLQRNCIQGPTVMEQVVERVDTISGKSPLLSGTN